MEGKKFYSHEGLYVRIPQALDHLKSTHGARVDFKNRVTQIRCYADKENHGLLKPVNSSIETKIYQNMGTVTPYVNLTITVRPRVAIRILSGGKRVYPYYSGLKQVEKRKINLQDLEYEECYNIPHCRILKVSRGGFVEIRDLVFHKQATGTYYHPLVIFSGRLPFHDSKEIVLAEAQNKSVENHLEILMRMWEVAENNSVIPLPTRAEVILLKEENHSLLKKAEETEDFGEVVKFAKGKRI
ncbi:MAG: hypothetical protein HYV52_02345 [Parcubacteria group bacterium]|nr:hypothetical protein [Parcubacteria group bacterium]